MNLRLQAPVSLAFLSSHIQLETAVLSSAEMVGALAGAAPMQETLLTSRVQEKAGCKQGLSSDICSNAHTDKPLLTTVWSLTVGLEPLGDRFGHS